MGRPLVAGRSGFISGKSTDVRIRYEEELLLAYDEYRIFARATPSRLIPSLY